jgi:hypothetical protein
MTIFAITSALVASLLLSMAGYLFGLRAGTQERERLRGEVGRLALVTQQRDTPPQSEADGLRSTIQEVLAPLVERERVSLDLAQFNISVGERRDLSRLLDTIATVGHFKTVLLSNEEGLPLAANRGTRNAERLAASLTRLALVVDQTAGAEGHSPVSILLRDASDATTLCRIFRVRGQRLFFTAQSNDLRLTSTDLDPALTKVEAALSSNDVAISA